MPEAFTYSLSQDLTVRLLDGARRFLVIVLSTMVAAWPSTKRMLAPPPWRKQ